MMCDQRIGVNWKRNTQLQCIVHYFIVSRIISAAMLCTVRTLLLWDLLTRMIIELNSHVADKPPKRMLLWLFQSSLIPVGTLWSEFMHNLCATECTVRQERSLIHWPYCYTIYILWCVIRELRVNWVESTFSQFLPKYCNLGQLFRSGNLIKTSMNFTTLSIIR